MPDQDNIALEQALLRLPVKKLINILFVKDLLLNELTMVYLVNVIYLTQCKNQDLNLFY